MTWCAKSSPRSATMTAAKASTATPARVLLAIAKQSGDIALGVDKALEAKTGEMTEAEDRGHRRRRPGHDVRLCLQRDPHPDAHAHLPGAQARPPPDRAAQERHAALAAPGWQEPGDGGIQLRQAQAHRHGADQHPARPGYFPRRDPRIDHRARHHAHPARRDGRRGPENLRQPHRPVRDRRPAGRRRRDRAQDHRRYLRRHGPPRRRLLQRQRSHQGGPLGGLRRALGGQERGRRRAWPTAARSRWPTPSAWPTR